MTRRLRPNLKTLGTTLRKLRMDHGLSQDRLANQAGVDRAYVGGIERGERHPTWEVVERLLRTLDVSWTEFGKTVDRHTQ